MEKAMFGSKPMPRSNLDIILTPVKEFIFFDKTSKDGGITIPTEKPVFIEYNKNFDPKYSIPSKFLLVNKIDPLISKNIEKIIPHKIELTKNYGLHPGKFVMPSHSENFVLSPEDQRDISLRRAMSYAASPLRHQRWEEVERELENADAIEPVDPAIRANIRNQYDAMESTRAISHLKAAYRVAFSDYSFMLDGRQRSFDRSIENALEHDSSIFTKASAYALRTLNNLMYKREE